jgi:hypothetical protein
MFLDPERDLSITVLMQSGPDKSGAGHPQPPPNQPPAAENLPDRVIHQITAKLHDGHAKDAARLFIEAHHRGVVPKGPQLLQWMLATPGRDDSTKLMAAFTHFPCVCCKGGLEPCEACGGQGVRSEGPFCETCAGLGMARCEFCDGAGLATYSFFPEELWLPIIVERSHLAIHQLSLIIQQPIPRISDPAAEQNHAHLILNLNKLIGLLENAVTTAQEVAHHDSHQETLNRIIHSSNHAAALATQYLRQSIRSLAAAIRQAAKSLPPDSAEAQFRESRAGFYDSLSHSVAFEGTCLHHPFLSLKSDK